jgi:hypothetical protein
MWCQVAEHVVANFVGDVWSQIPLLDLGVLVSEESLAEYVLLLSAVGLGVVAHVLDVLVVEQIDPLLLVPHVSGGVPEPESTGSGHRCLSCLLHF